MRPRGPHPADCATRTAFPLLARLLSALTALSLNPGRARCSGLQEPPEPRARLSSRPERQQPRGVLSSRTDAGEAAAFQVELADGYRTK